MSEQVTASTTTLRIAFGGLCLLVRDRKGAEGYLHALLPGGTGAAEAHEARLYFDVRHLLGDGAPKGMCSVSLQDVLLDLAGLGVPGTADVEKTHILPDVGYGATRGVPREYFEAADPGGLVKARISMAAGTRGRVNPGGRWKLGASPLVFMPTAVEWVIPGLSAGPLSLRLGGLNQTGHKGELQLLPLRNEISLVVFHSPERELPTSLPSFPFPVPSPPGKCAKAVHFAAYYPLVRGTVEEPLPTYECDGTAAPSTQPAPDLPCHGRGSHIAGEGHADGQGAGRGIEFTCMLATASAEPEPSGV